MYDFWRRIRDCCWFLQNVLRDRPLWHYCFLSDMLFRSQISSTFYFTDIFPRLLIKIDLYTIVLHFLDVVKIRFLWLSPFSSTFLTCRGQLSEPWIVKFFYPINPHQPHLFICRVATSLFYTFTFLLDVKLFFFHSIRLFCLDGKQNATFW